MIEHGQPVPITTRDDDPDTMSTGPAFSASHDQYTYVETDWRAVPKATRDKLNPFRLWLQRDLDVRFHIAYHREERDPEAALLSLAEDAVRRLDQPHAIPKAHRHSVPWAGQVTTKHPMFVRLNVEAPADAMLETLAHEARHVWQLANWETFLPPLVIEHKDVDAARDLMEIDASSYARKAVARWNGGPR